MYAMREWVRSGERVAVCCPTGKAAVRCTEQLRRAGVILEAKTIHRTLKVTRSGYDGSGWGFMHNEFFKLPFDRIIVDEVSMLDTCLGASFFSAVPDHAHVLLVGDPYQLAPVGHGAPLRDLIAAGIPNGHLEKIWRNSGLIVRGCHSILDGQPIQFAKTPNEATGDNLVHVDTGSPSLNRNRILSMLENCPSKYDPVWDVQILVTVNKSGPLSRESLNTLLQDKLNPNGARSPYHRFRVRDKIICTSNSWLPVDGGDPKQVEFVANGEMGIVQWVSDRRVGLLFFGPMRHVVFPLQEQDNEMIGDIDLGYAITVHKSQGSQFPVTIMVVDNNAAARWVASRELYYTGLSRAEKLCFVVGSLEVLAADCERTALQDRQTLLTQRLLDGLAV